MKKLLFILLFAVLNSIDSFAQDVIVTHDTKVYKVYKLDVAKDMLYYTLSDDDDAPIQKLAKSEVLIIKYADGSTQQFQDDSQPVPQPEQKPSETENEQQIVSDRSDDSANQACIKKYSEINRIVPDQYTNKKADASLLHFAPTRNSVLSNKDIEVHYQLSDSELVGANDEFYDPQSDYFVRIYDTATILVSVENKTNKIIYLDLANSFYRLSGEAMPYYVPESVSYSTGTSGGVSVNLGGVANAIGIGGAAGALAGAVNVGGGNNRSATNIKYSQRIVAVPPHSKVTLKGQPLFPNKSMEAFGDIIKKMTAWGIVINPLYKAYSVPTERKYAEGTSMTLWSTFISYGFAEDKANTYSVAADFYLKSIYGFRQFWTSKSHPECFAPFKDAVVILMNNYLH